MEILFALFIVLAIITVIGHVIWIAIAAILRAMSGGGHQRETTELNLRQPVSRQPHFCLHCGASLQAGGSMCFSCGRKQEEAGKGSEALNDLAATERQLQRFRGQGILDDLKFNWLSRLIENERQRLNSIPAPEARPIVIETPIQSEAPIIREAEINQPEPTILSVLSELILQPQIVLEEAAPYQPPIIIPAPKPEIVARVEAPPPEPPAPKKSFAEMLTSFMEEKNIRWGELLGGMLIIGCSLALVISLWSQIEQIPLLKFFIFTAMTGAFAGLGFYSELRWKLPNTSRGLLITATMLVPLNFLAIAAFAKDISSNSPIVIISELVSLALFVLMVNRAGKIITPTLENWLTIGAVGASATQLILRRIAAPASSTTALCLLAALPIACYAVAIFGMVRKTREVENIEASQANQNFTLLGASSFAVLTSLGLLLFKIGNYSGTLQRLAPMISLLAIPALFASLTLWQRVKNVEPQYLSLASASSAVFSAMVMLASLAFAWPDAKTMMIVAVINFVVITAASFIFSLPGGHLLALPCLVFAYLLGINLTLWHLNNLSNPMELFSALASVTSGSALAFLFVAVGLAAEMLHKRERKDDGKFYALVAAAIGVASLFLVSVFGFGQTGDPHHIAWVYALFAASAFYVTWRMNFVYASFAGLGLAFLALVQFLYFGFSQSFKITALIYTSVVLAASFALRRGAEKLSNLFAAPCQHAALAVSILSAVILVITASVNTAFALGWQSLWLALLVVSLAWLYRSPVLFTAFQAVTYATVFLAVTATLYPATLLADLPFGLSHYRPQMIALALLSPLWILLRLGLRKLNITREEAISQNSAIAWHNSASRLLYPEFPTCDQVVTWLLIFCFVALSIFRILPGVLEDLTPTVALNLRPIHISALSEWMLLAALLLVLIVSLWEQFTKWRVLGILLLLAMISPLYALSSGSPASALRWMAAAYLLVTSSAIWFRNELHQAVVPLRFPLLNTEAAELPGYARALTLALAGLPIIFITLFVTTLRLASGTTLTPVHSPFFARVGATISYLVPLLILSFVLVGHAIRERSAAYAFSGALVLNFSVTSLYSMSLPLLNGASLMKLTQLNSITSAGFALAWLGVRMWWQQRHANAEEPINTGALLNIQCLIGATICSGMFLLSGVRIFAEPVFSSSAVTATGGAFGWIAFGMSVFALAWMKRLQRTSVSLSNIAFALFATGILLACTLSRWDNGNWLSYHTLLLSSLITSALMLLGGFKNQQTTQGESFVVAAVPRDAVRLTILFALLSLLFSWRALGVEPNSPWWTIATFAVLSLIVTGLARLTLDQLYLYVAGFLVNDAVTIWYEYARTISSPHNFIDLLTVNIIALALVGITFFAFEKKVMQEAERRIISYHHFAAVVATAGLLLPVGNALTADFFAESLTLNSVFYWTGLVTTIALMIVNLWDARASFAVAGLYVLGLISAGMILDQFSLAGRSLIFAATMSLAVYVVVTSFGWAEKAKLIEWSEALGIPRRESSSNNWLVIVNSLLITVIVVTSGVIILNFDLLSQRIFAALAVLLQSLSFVFLARGTKFDATRSWLQTFTFGAGIGGAIFLGWAFLPPGNDFNLISRVVIVLLVALAAVEVIGLWFIKRFANEWSAAAKRLIRPLCGITAVALSFVLAHEVIQQISSGNVVTPMWAIISVAVILFGLSMQAIYFAVRAASDPLQLSERGRMGYVYASEALLATTFIHIRLTMPWLFTGFFQRYWPMVVIVLAFLGVGLGEFFRRREQNVLGQPLLNTGVFLPIFPVVGFWFAASKVDYSGLLLMVGILYAVVAALRHSFGVSLLACLTANGSLWYLLSRTDNFSLLERPQLWLAPVAISVLIAAYLNRERLSPAQMTNLRYITLSVLYVSSTAEIFVRGVALSPWQPLVLMLLSAAGVLLGIMLRVRAFLYLGSSFLMISILTMVWHASANFGWTWLWYVTGIVLGLTIILLFAMFEKKRSEFLSLVEGLKTWEA